MNTEKTEPDYNVVEKDLSAQPVGYDSFKQQPTGSSMPTIAGLILILAGLLGLFTWASYFLVDPAQLISQLNLQGIELPSQITPEQMISIFQMCSVIGIILSVFTLLGGILAFKKKRWELALVGSLMGLFIIGPFLSASILSLVGLILVGISKKDFQ
ncbi:MAG: hypothetical protein QHH19_03420 [Candidatus Thermoplasmatota archaeon]|jgi:hypothetical protein|nr:hypothetical protein [Candidatus Thermoplasmatota archaeon]